MGVWGVWSIRLVAVQPEAAYTKTTTSTMDASMIYWTITQQRCSPTSFPSRLWSIGWLCSLSYIFRDTIVDNL
jgi:hypothetical protein